MAHLYKGGLYMAQKINRYPIIIDGETALIGTPMNCQLPWNLARAV